MMRPFDEHEFEQRLVEDAAEIAAIVLEDAGVEIWHSMRKFDGQPHYRDDHPIGCGCTYCN
jgi:hypothetical protein